MKKITGLLLIILCIPIFILNADQCFPIKEIRVSSNAVLSRRQIKRITKKYIGRCAIANDLNEIIRLVTDACVQKGYVTTRAFIQEQSIASGILEIHVMEGRLESIEFDENSRSSLSLLDQSQVLTAFSRYKNKLLNLRNIEQGLSQMNRLSSKNVAMKIYPGSKEGFSKIVLSNGPARSQVRVRTGADNAGQESTGLYNVRLSLDQEDLLKMNDSWSLSYSQSDRERTNDRRSQSFYANMNVPFRYWSVNANVIQSDYSAIIVGTNQYIRNTGKGFHQNYKLDRSLYRGKNQIFSAWAQINLKNTESFIEDTKSEVGSRKLTVLKCGVHHNIVTPIGYFDYTAAYHRGIPALDAKQDDDGVDDFTPRAQFQKAELSLSYNKPFRLFHNNFSFKTYASGQYGFNPLYSTEQIVIGDAYSVRGFKEKSGFGDQGFYAMNELTLSLPGFITENWGVNSSLRKTEWFAGYDVGLVKSYGGIEANDGQGKAFLTGWATGLRFSGKFVYFDVIYAQSVHTEDFIGRSSAIYATASVNLF